MRFAEQNRASMGRQSPTRSPGFVGTLSAEQRTRMLNALTSTELSAYNSMDASSKAIFESNYADAHWDIVSGARASRTQAEINADAAQQQRYFSATEQALNVTAGTISTALANNNQQVLLQLRNDGAAQIASIQAQLQRDLAPTEATRLRYQLDALQQTQAALDAQRNQTAQTFSYIGAAAVVLAIGGLYLWSQQQARKNPVVERSNHKMFLPMSLLSKGEQDTWRHRHPRKHAA